LASGIKPNNKMGKLKATLLSLIFLLYFLAGMVQGSDGWNWPFMDVAIGRKALEKL